MQKRYKQTILLGLIFLLAAACNAKPVATNVSATKENTPSFVNERIRGGTDNTYSEISVVEPTPASKLPEQAQNKPVSIPQVFTVPKTTEQTCNSDLECLTKAVKNNCQVFSATLNFSGGHPLASGIARYSTTRFYEVKGSVSGKCEIAEKYISGKMEYIQSALDAEIQKGDLTKEYADQFKAMQEDAYKKAAAKSASCTISSVDFVQHLNDYTQGYLYSDIPIFVSVYANNDPYSSSCKGALYNN